MNLPAPPAGKTGWPWEAEAVAPLFENQTFAGQAIDWPRLTIVTPSFNQGRFLEATIRSVLLQGYPNLEFIIIDGGSTDETLALIRRYEPWLTHWVSEPDRGHAHALNKGFARATGDILAWLNSDDLYLPNALPNVARAFQAYPQVEWLTSTALAHCDEAEQVTLRDNAGFSRSYFFAAGYAGFAHAKGWPYESVYLQQESTFWRRSLWERTGAQLNEQLKLAIDFELWSRFWQSAQLHMLAAPLGCFRVHATQRSRTQFAAYQRETLQCIGLTDPPALARFARLYRRLGLARIVGWERFIAMFYGEANTVIHPTPDGSYWQSQTHKLV